MRSIGSSLAIKSAVAGVILFTIVLHIIQAIWISERISSKTGFRYKHADDLYVDVTTTRVVLASTFSSKIFPATQMRIEPAEVDYYRWKSGRVQCSYKNATRRESRMGDVLPSKYAEVIWPPLSVSLCGEGELLSPWSLDRQDKS